MADLRTAINDEMQWGKTWNGADALVTTQNACLDMFGRAGAMRQASVEDKELMFSQAFAEDKDIAMKLLFYTRDIRGGYGERDTFNQMLAHLATINVESVEKNLWAVLEFGRAKDLYSLIGTPAEETMWQFMSAQFQMDYRNMQEGNSISLLAKWIATPDSKSEKTKALGKLTAKKLGYDFKHMSEYKKMLREMRKYLDLPEAKMCAGKWDEIEYSKCASKFMLKNRKALQKHDPERYAEFFKKVESGEEKVNTGTLTPVDIMHKVAHDYTAELDTLWANLKDVCKGNALVMCDTSGSMARGLGSVPPIEAAIALSVYFAERNKGNLKDLFLTFSSYPQFMDIKGANLYDKYRYIRSKSIIDSTDLEAAFDLLLKTCIKGKVAQEDMPDAIVIVSDMQINCVKGVDARTNRVTFYDVMAQRYADAGYKMPQVVFWNVNAENPTFHAAKSVNGVSLVSGYSVNIFKQVMENIGTTPMELMMAVVNAERYKDIVA